MGKGLSMQVFKYKYLGVVMDDCLSWRDHVHHALMKASARVGMLRRLRNDISMHTANIVYKSYVLPTLDYCDTVWNCCNLQCRG
jgi:Zn-finger domain-containing protein